MSANCTRDYMHDASHEALEHPFKVEVELPGEDWGSNALTFATVEDGQTYGRDLLSHWFLPTDSRVVDTRTGEVVG